MKNELAFDMGVVCIGRGSQLITKDCLPIFTKPDQKLYLSKL